MIDKEKIPDIKLILFDLEGVIIKESADKNEQIDKEIYATFENFCKKLDGKNLITGIVTAREEDNLIKELREIECLNVLSASIDKTSQTEKLLKKYFLEYKNVCFIGHDILDIPLLQRSGLSIAAKMARREVKRVVDYISKSSTLEELLQEIINILDDTE